MQLALREEDVIKASGTKVEIASIVGKKIAESAMKKGLSKLNLIVMGIYTTVELKVLQTEQGKLV